MKHPIRRKQTERRCPINVGSLYRRWERGDKRIDWPKIQKLLYAWEDGEKVPWRKLSHTFIKKGQRPVRRRLRPRRRQRERNIFGITAARISRNNRRNDNNDEYNMIYYRPYIYYDYLDDLVTPATQQVPE